MKTKNTSLKKSYNCILLYTLLFLNLNIFSQTGDNLDLENTTVTQSNAQDLKEKGLDYISIDEKTLTPGVYPVVIPKAEWIKLNNIANNLYSTNGSPCASYITALRIWLGVDPINPPALKLFFQPLYMCKTGTDNGYNIYETQPNSTVNNFSVLIGTNFTPQDTGTALIDYKAHLKIDRFFSANTRGYLSSEDKTGDARSMIYPFQEIFSLIDDNQGSTGIYIWNIGYRDLIGLQVYTKHGLLLSPDNFGLVQKNLSKATIEEVITRYKSTYQKMYGDKANLCPPDCDRVKYKILDKAK